MDKTFDIEKYKQRALRILSPIKQIDKHTSINSTKLFHAQRSNAGRNLPEYYLVYFLFGELLGFKNAGQFEKVAWSFTIDFNGKAFVIEYRKMGLGIFVQDIETDEADAEAIANKIRIAVMSAPPFYEYIAKQAIDKSELNVVNNNIRLLSRFDFLFELYKKEKLKIITQARELIIHDSLRNSVEREAMYYGTGAMSEIDASHIEITPTGTRAHIHFAHRDYDISVRAFGGFHIVNLLPLYALCEIYSLSTDGIAIYA